LPVPSANSAPIANELNGDATAGGAPTGSLTESSQAASGAVGLDGTPAGDQMGPAAKSFALIALAEHQPDVVFPGSTHTDGEQQSGTVNSVVAPNTDALQITLLETGNSSAQPIVLTTNPETVDVALQQALQQAGVDPSVLHDSASTPASTVGSTASGSTQDTAVVGKSISQTAPSQVTPIQVASDSAATPASLSDNQIEHIVTGFLASTPSYEITVSGTNVVILDTNPSDLKSGGYSVETFNMSDGSTLSIVGIIHHPLSLSA
jgi:hypothetical protein